MLALDPDIRFTAFVNQELAGSPGFRLDERVALAPLRVHSRRRSSWALGEALLVPVAASRARVDLVHGLANFGPLYGRFRRVLSLHDLMFMKVPELLPRANRHRESRADRRRRAPRPPRARVVRRDARRCHRAAGRRPRARRGAAARPRSRPRRAARRRGGERGTPASTGARTSSPRGSRCPTRTCRACSRASRRSRRSGVRCSCSPRAATAASSRPRPLASAWPPTCASSAGSTRRRSRRPTRAPRASRCRRSWRGSGCRCSRR